jgi:hypothetical protein
MLTRTVLLEPIPLDRQVNMPDAHEDKLSATLHDALKALAGSWAAYSALGSFALYLAGYLALRFHLTTLGLGTDLAVLDERYVFTGARFLIFLGALLPAVVLLSLLLLAIYWLLARVARIRVLGERMRAWWAQPSRLALLGIVVAVLLIQLLMRQCFALNHLLLAECLPPPGWLRGLLLDQTSASLYFTGLVAGICLTGGLWYAARRAAAQTAWSRAWTNLLAVLVAIQFLLLPVNYGVLVVDKTLTKVADLGGVESLRDGQQAWLVWEGKEGVTWLVWDNDLCGKSQAACRKLVTLPQKEVKKTQIIRYDALAQALTGGPCAAP